MLFFVQHTSNETTKDLGTRCNFVCFLLNNLLYYSYILCLANGGIIFCIELLL